MLLISKAFDRFGFSSWKCAMKIALTAKNKLVFVDHVINLSQVQKICILWKCVIVW